MHALLMLNLIIPFVMILVGYMFKNHPVSTMESNNGYNTPTSRKSKKHWDYAQRIAPGNFIYFGKTNNDFFIYTIFPVKKNKC